MVLLSRSNTAGKVRYHTVLKFSYRSKAQWFCYQEVILSRRSVTEGRHNGFVIKKLYCPEGQ